MDACLFAKHAHPKVIHHGMWLLMLALVGTIVDTYNSIPSSCMVGHEGKDCYGAAVVVDNMANAKGVIHILQEVHLVSGSGTTTPVIIVS